MGGVTIPSGRRLSPGAIAGIVIGGVAMLAMLGPLLFYLGRTRKEVDLLKRDAHIQSHQQSAPDVKVSHTEYAPPTPSLRYGPDDPRIGEQPADEAPPYSIYTAAPATVVAELDSAVPTRSTTHNTREQNGDQMRYAVPPSIVVTNEGLGLGKEQHEQGGMF